METVESVKVAWLNVAMVIVLLSSKFIQHSLAFLWTPTLLNFVAISCNTVLLFSRTAILKIYMQLLWLYTICLVYMYVHIHAPTCIYYTQMYPCTCTHSHQFPWWFLWTKSLKVLTCTTVGNYLPSRMTTWPSLLSLSTTLTNNTSPSFTTVVLELYDQEPGEEYTSIATNSHTEETHACWHSTIATLAWVQC